MYYHLETRIKSHVRLWMISLCLIRTLEQELRAEEITYYQALNVINQTTSAVVGNKRKYRLIDPLYTYKFIFAIACFKLNVS